MSEEVYSIPLVKLAQEFSLEEIVIPDNYNDILITTPEISRPGLALAGFFEIFDAERIQMIGNAEHRYLIGLEPEERRHRIVNYIQARPVAVLYTTALPVFEEMAQEARKVGVPILRTEKKTSPIMAAMIGSLNTHLAPRITRHGVLVEVYGEGMLLLGDSGVGKSETAIELIKRGHRLIADDAVEIKRVSDKTLLGTAPEIIRHYVELRGIGIIDEKSLYGVESVKDTQNIDMVIKLEDWDKDKEYDRLGLEDRYTEFLGNQVVCHNIPIRPGRNLAIIVESAAVNYRQKKMGYNAAQELYNRVQANLGNK